MTARRPAEGFSPGEYISEEIAERGWSLHETRKHIPWPTPVIGQVLMGTCTLDEKMAADLAAAFGTSSEMWLNLDRAYQEWKRTMGTRRTAALPDAELASDARGESSE